MKYFVNINETASFSINYLKTLYYIPIMAQPRAWSAISAVLGVGWLVFVIVYIVFYADNTGFTFFQNIAVLLTSLLVLLALISVIWITYGMRMARDTTDEMSAAMIPSGWRVSISAVIAFGWVIFALLFIAFYSGDFSFLENLAILIISLIVIAFLLVAIWMGYWMKQSRIYGRMKRKPE